VALLAMPAEIKARGLLLTDLRRIPRSRIIYIRRGALTGSRWKLYSHTERTRHGSGVLRNLVDPRTACPLIAT
jgi:hypothetical protein